MAMLYRLLSLGLPWRIPEPGKFHQIMPIEKRHGFAIGAFHLFIIQSPVAAMPGAGGPQIVHGVYEDPPELPTSARCPNCPIQKSRLWFASTQDSNRIYDPWNKRWCKVIQ